MRIGQACELARVLGGSLDWLVGRSVEPGVALVQGTRFDGQRAAELRVQRGIPEARIRGALKLGLGPYRRLLKGQLEPTLGQVVALAEVLGMPLDQFLSSVGHESDGFYSGRQS